MKPTCWALPAPEAYVATLDTHTGRYIGPEHCPDCGGRKVTGDRYKMFAGTSSRVLLVDLLCSTCLGCGRAEHIGCAPAEHADWQDQVADTATDQCPSCRGRGWWACQGFDDTATFYFRVACGCAGDRLVQVSDGD